MLKKLLIIDDEENMLHMLEAMLSRTGYSITTTQSGTHALDLIQDNTFDYILCDIKMPEINGLELIKKIKLIRSNCTIIMMSAYGSVDTAIEAIKNGAYDFISKPFKKDEVLLALRKAEERETLKQENQYLKEEIQKVNKNRSFSNIIHQSSIMKSCIELAQKVAKFDTSILITGDSGTGKELLAQGIHHHSLRNKSKFHAINCGSIPSNLLESELFGYKKGAFTGADKDKKGIFQEASGSTLFLDEIGELPLSMQVKLLRVLQENEIKPLGSNTPKKIDVRIISATAKDLTKEVQEGNFREDLYYRLNVMQIFVPPLNVREDDLPLLCYHFLKYYSKKFGKNVNSISPDALTKLSDYHWPGNVRELENTIQRAMILTNSSTISDQQIPTFKSIENPELNSICGSLLSISSLKVAKKKLEKEFISRTLKETKGNKSSTAKILELSYPSLLNKIKLYNLDDI